MSVVTSIILSVSASENGFDFDENETYQIDKINAFLRHRGKTDLHFLTPHMHNGKHPQTLTFGGGYNFFPEDDFLNFVSVMEWQSPENVILIIQPDQGRTLVWRPV